MYHVSKRSKKYDCMACMADAEGLGTWVSVTKLWRQRRCHCSSATKICRGFLPLPKVSMEFSWILLP